MKNNIYYIHQIYKFCLLKEKIKILYKCFYQQKMISDVSSIKLLSCTAACGSSLLCTDPVNKYQQI